MVQHLIEKLLNQKIGLDTSSVGKSVIFQAINHRMSRCGLKRIEDYWNKVQTCSEELQELIEKIVVPETWFFRDPEAFTALTQLTINEWLISNSGNVMQILSVPCSTGEEPYSIVMALLDNGLPLDRFNVEALDINRRALYKAKQAIYGTNSFRSHSLEFRDRYFQLQEESYQLIDCVRNKVRFKQGNLLLANHQPEEARYHVIFCRNLLIYFDPPTQQQALRKLNRLLVPNGLLFVGPAETYLARNNGFTSINIPMSFGYRKTAYRTKAIQQDQSNLKKKEKHATPSSDVKTKPVVKTELTTLIKSTLQIEDEDPNINLDLAISLADAGRLNEAAEICRSHLDKNQESSKAHFTLGLVYDALGYPKQAATCYRKTIYLEPDHIEALVHLALLADKEGNIDLARRLRLRAERAQSRTNK
jgi:chemotaxis protein methyltransferase WspC